MTSQITIYGNGLSIYGKFVKSQTVSFSREDINTHRKRVKKLAELVFIPVAESYLRSCPFQKEGWVQDNMELNP